jgi:uncharacterized protein (TIGR00725 family)
MSREWIIGVIGGSDKRDEIKKAAGLANALGKLITPGTGILLTGGEPPNLDTVKDAAISGCKNVGGLMISVLPKKAKDSVRRKEKHIILETILGSLQRDPITGAAADIVVVFDGDAGTLVELAYAAANGRPIIFCGNPPKLSEDKSEKFNSGLKAAFDAYGELDPTPVKCLKNALNGCFAPDGSVTRPRVETAEQALTTIKKWTAGQPPEGTNFLGLPKDKEIKDRFETLVQELSVLARVSESDGPRRP